VTRGKRLFWMLSGTKQSAIRNRFMEGDHSNLPQENCGKMDRARGALYPSQGT
jgi:hypothetical protein